MFINCARAFLFIDMMVFDELALLESHFIEE